MGYDFDRVIDRRQSDSVKFHGVKNKPQVIPMWIADTDFAAPAEIQEALAERIRHPCFGYPFADPRFAGAVAGWEERRFGWKVREEWVLYASGVLPYITFALEAFTDPGDAVLIQTPAYPPFHWLVENNGRRLVKNPMRQEEDGRYRIDYEDLERRLVEERVKLVLLCNPQNPTMRCFTREELERVGTLCLRCKTLVIADEIHCDICYPGHRHIPFASLSEELAAITVTLINPSKTFNIAGLRAGAAIVPDRDLRERLFRVAVSHKGDSRNILGAAALIAAYTKCDAYVDALVAYLKENCRLAEEFIVERLPELAVAPPEATYLLWLDCRRLSMGQRELCRFFEEEARVLLNDGRTFGEEGIGFMRMNVGCPRSVLRQALEQIEKAVRRWQGGSRPDMR